MDAIVLHLRCQPVGVFVEQVRGFATYWHFGFLVTISLVLVWNVLVIR
jgi:hypothetical protein